MVVFSGLQKMLLLKEGCPSFFPQTWKVHLKKNWTDNLKVVICNRILHKGHNESQALCGAVQ